jgi:hypothetical protein
MDEAVRVLKPGGAIFIYNLPHWAHRLATQEDASMKEVWGGGQMRLQRRFWAASWRPCQIFTKSEFSRRSARDLASFMK